MAIRFAVVMVLCLLVGKNAYAFDDDYKAPINGTTLHFRVRGANKANPYLLILHAGPGYSAHMYYTWGASLEQNLNVVYLDQRGCGESKHLTIATAALPSEDEIKDYTMANLVKDIEGVRQYLKLEKWYVLGHAWGAMLGVEYTAAHPESVAGFVIMDGLISQPRTQDSIIDGLQAWYEHQRESTDPAQKTSAAKELETVQVLRQMPAGDARMTVTFGLAGQDFVRMYFAHAYVAPEVQLAVNDACKKYKLNRADVIAREPVTALKITEQYGSRDDTRLLASISPPTLIINGLQDEIITPISAQITKSGIKGSRLILLDSCGHYPYVEQPAKTTAAILNFVREHPQ